ncbi:unnamed protein product [Rotaria sp. Silwood2]|nr:unnamed protein product [Rotaria sp. Silwood2]
MAEVHRITQLLRERASKNLPAQSTLTALQEEELADQLFNVFESIWTSTTYNEEDETTLDNNTSDNEIDDCKDDSDERSDDPDYKEDDEKPVFESFTMSYMTRALDYYHEINPKTGKRSHSWKSIQYKFRRITHQSYMARFRDYVEQKGIKKQKIDILADHVYNNFERARDLLCPVHDMDLKRWGIRESRSMSFHNFVASDTWLLNFKHKYNICSRKIIKVVTKRELINEDDIRSSAEEFINEVVTKRELINEDDIRSSAEEFINEVKLLLPYYNEDFVLNTDQSGFELEIPPTRTLSYRGEKTTLATVRSINATTHSYTI